jgi:2'-5' RNA ligase
MTRSIYDNIWERFAHGDHIAQMPRRDGIGVGLIVHIQEQAIVEKTSVVLSQLEQLNSFVPVPLDTLHLTVRNLGALVDEPKGQQAVSSEQLPALIEAIGRALTSVHKFPVHLQRINSFFVCPIVEVHDNGRILAIRQRLEKALESLGLTDFNYGPRGFVPHLTLGYYTEDGDGAMARQLLSALRETDIGQIQVTELVLIRADLTAGVCCLEPIHTFELL